MTMPVHRLPIATDIQTRDGTAVGARLINAIVDGEFVRSRPGLYETTQLFTSASPQLLVEWNGTLYMIANDTLYSDVNNGSMIPSGASFTSLGAVSSGWSGALMSSTTNGTGTHWLFSYSGGQIKETQDCQTFTARTVPTGTASAICYHSGALYAIVNASTNNIRRSTDGGATWSTVGNCGSDVRTNPAMVSFDGKLWVLGGYVGSAGTKNVFWSTNGVSWTEATASAAFVGDYAHAVLNFDSRMWHIPTVGTDGVYYSTDGVTWTLATATPGWANIGPHQASSFVYGGRMFVVTAATNAVVWSSADGITWTQTNAGAAFGGQRPVITTDTTWIVGEANGALTGVYSAVPDTPSSDSFALSPTTSGLRFSAQANGADAASQVLMLKNRTQAWTFDGTTATAITDTDYPGNYTVTLTSLTRSGSVATATTAIDTNFQVGGTVTIAGAGQSEYNGTKTILSVAASQAASEPISVRSITRSSTTATVTTFDPHGFSNGASVVIAGASQSEYNGTFTITWLSATTFSYTVTVTAGTPVTPATGTPVCTVATATITSITGNGSTAYFTYSGNLLFEVGGSVVIVGSGSWDGTHTITGFQGGAATIPTFASAAAGIGYTGTVSKGANPTISSITRSGNVATVTTSAAHNLASSDGVTISGCAQPEYNKTTLISKTGANTFTYQVSVTTSDSPATPATGTITAGLNDAQGASFTFAVSGSPATPATGTITALSGRNTVPGIVYLDGYFFVMDEFGVIYNSGLGEPGTYSALDYITAQNETGDGKALAKSLNYVVAFKEWSTEFFYDAANATGSPLSPVENAFTQVGCVSGDSLAQIDGMLVWLSQTRQSGRSVHVMQGMQQEKISTPDIDRILNRMATTEIYAYGLKVDGHSLYVLTSMASITLVYDFSSKVWTRWSSLSELQTQSVTSITRVADIATITTSSPHGLGDGAIVKISGATQTEYNDYFIASYVSTTAFSVVVSGTPATPATGTITVTDYGSTAFKYTLTAPIGTVDYFTHWTDGKLYQTDQATYRDGELPVVFTAISKIFDFGSTVRKKMAAVSLIGNKETGVAAVWWSDDDYTTASAVRFVDLSEARTKLYRCGSFRRRSMGVSSVANAPIQLTNFDLEV
jgi:hypothetical protein